MQPEPVSQAPANGRRPRPLAEFAQELRILRRTWENDSLPGGILSELDLLQGLADGRIRSDMAYSQQLADMAEARENAWSAKARAETRARSAEAAEAHWRDEVWRLQKILIGMALVMAVLAVSAFVGWWPR